jgi:hypothetical protein
MIVTFPLNQIKIFLLILIFFSTNRLMGQKLNTTDIISIYNKSIGNAESYLSNKGFVFTKNGKETSISCYKFSWIPVGAVKNEIITKRYCGNNMEDENPYVEYIFKSLPHFNSLKNSLNSLGFKRVDTFENVNGLNVIYQKINDPIYKIQFTSNIDSSNLGGKFSLRYFEADLILPYED